MDNAVATNSAAPQSETPATGVIHVERSLIDRGIHGDQAAVEAMFRQFVPAQERFVSADYLGYQGTSFNPGEWAHSDIGPIIVLLDFLMTLTIGGWLRSRCFGAVTNRRVATITVGPFGEVHYGDAFLENINSSFLSQPSKIPMYFLCATCFVLLPILTLGPIYLIWWLVSALAQHDTLNDVGPPHWGATPTFVLYVLLGGLGIVYGVRLFNTFYKTGLVFVAKKALPVFMYSDRKRAQVVARIYRTLGEMREARRKAMRAQARV